MRRINQDGQRLRKDLVTASLVLSQSSTHIEDVRWEHMLHTQVYRALTGRTPSVVNDAVNDLSQMPDSAGYDELLAAIECVTESTCGDSHPTETTLMVAMPILFWTVNRSPSCHKLTDGEAEAVVKAVRPVFTVDARINLLGHLLAVENLPREYTDILALRVTLANGRPDPDLVERLVEPEPPLALADTRYLVMAVSVPFGQPIFSYQTSIPAARGKDRLQQGAGTAVVAALQHQFVGCKAIARPVIAYHEALRKSDLELRTFSLAANLEFLQLSYGLKPKDLLVTIAEFNSRFSDGSVDSELRIGFAGPNNPGRVLAGLVWPLYNDPVDAATEEILRSLELSGCRKNEFLPETFPLDVTDTDGGMLFPTSSGVCGQVEYPAKDEVPQFEAGHTLQ